MSAKTAKKFRRVIRKEVSRMDVANGSAAGNPSTQRTRERSPWDEAQAADKVERADGNGTRISHASMAAGFARIAKDRGEYAGMPMPLRGERLTVEPSYAFADQCAKINEIFDPPQVRTAEDKELDGAKIRNTFWSWSKRSNITIWELNGKVNWGLDAGVHHLEQDLRTLGCADAWSLETESKAMATLRDLVPHRLFRQYLLTGSFIETSRRSGVKYLFRRLKPTVAISAANNQLKVLCALCLHPIAYYSGSWAGAMCPTDDLLAHLMLMRGDEPMLWRRANQHSAWRPEAGL